MMKTFGAWVTDVDDTVVLSGEYPAGRIVDALSALITELKKQHVSWVAMSGVAMAKMGPRLLYRLPEEILDSIVYYAGDGSQRYSYSPETRMWNEDLAFRRVFSDAQALAVLGRREFSRQFNELSLQGGIRDVNRRLEDAAAVLLSKGYNPDLGILEGMKQKLETEGFNPADSETYFRGGSVSWMMLGDISAAPYRKERAVRVRKELLSFAEAQLSERQYLIDIGDGEVHVPFPGARGIKFVLSGNSKERALRHLIDSEDISNRRILFVGNELSDGGNDNMIRNIPDVTLLSLSRGETPGRNVVQGHFADDGRYLSEVDANTQWMNWASFRMSQGYPWDAIIHTMRLHGSSAIVNRSRFCKRHPGWNSSPSGGTARGDRKIDVIFFDKGGTLSHRERLDDDGRSQIEEIMHRVGAEGSVDHFGEMLDQRNKAYKQWSVDHWAELDEEAIWTRFMLPDFPDEIVRYHAQKLVLLYSHSKGLRRFNAEARDVIRELSSRGYRLGAITNTVSRVLVPGELDDAGIADYMEKLVMSSVTGIRKPDPRLFLLATRLMNADPSRCAYIGDQVDRDAEGPKRSGFGLSVTISGTKAPFVLDELEPIQKPDIVVDSLEDLLAIFE